LGRYKITLNLGKDLGTIEFEEDNEQIFKEKLATISELRNTVLSALSEYGLAMETEEHPVIGKPESVPDAITKLLSLSWGKVPRTLDELHSTLATNAVHYSKEALGSVLFKMVRKGKLSRTKKGKVYAYTIPLRLRT